MKNIKARIRNFIVVFIFITPGFLFAQNDNAKNEAIGTIESTGETMMYNTYCLIGALNDGYWASAWTKEATLGWIDEQITTLTNTENQYDNFLRTGFVTSHADSSYISDLKAECYYLKEEARKLEDYINNPTDETHKAYSEARSDAWEWLNVIEFDLWGDN